ncbi:MAG: ABC transporter permease [Spirochaetaceae bacterium]
MEFINALLSQIIVYTAIYTLVSLGVVIAGRTGIFNISGEGVMLTAAAVGFMGAFFSGSWLVGFLAGAAIGAIFGLILAFVHETFKVNQFILGIFLVILGTGLSDLLYRLIMGVRLTAPKAPPVPAAQIPLIGDIPIIGAVVNQNPIVYFVYIASALLFWFFYRTKMGLETRAIGESPQAADVVGVNVRRRRYVMTIIGAALMGIAGAYLPLVITGTYNPNMSAGRGFMAIGIAIFASWKPHRALLGGFIFALIEVVSYQLQLASQAIPFQFFLMLPFIGVIVIMMIFKRRIEFPASIGKPYSRE